MGKLQIEVSKIDSRFADFKTALALWAKNKVQKGQKLLTNYRVLAFSEGKDGSFTAHVYDYAKNKVVKIEGALPKTGSWKVFTTKWTVTASDPGETRLPPTRDEIAAAVKLVKQSLGAKVASYDFAPAMPGVLSGKIIKQARDAGLMIGAFIEPAERVVNISVRPRKGSQAATTAKPEIVSASLSSNQVAHYKYGAPPTAIASASDAQESVQALSKQGQPHVEFARNERRDDGTCGLEEDFGSHSPDRGTQGSATITLKRPTGEVLWQFDVTRPTASSGYWGSGIDLRNVYYKGVRVLKHGNVPIFNVQYVNNACGPYRDWGFEENRFKAKAAKILVGDETSGIIETSEPPQSLLQSGSDFGNDFNAGFYGVAIYTDQNQTTTLMTEMAAGWYRYVMMWTFYPDGSFQPQFGFGAIENACVCNRHFHHAYWRLEFDLGGKRSEPEKKATNIFEKMLPGQSNWTASTAQETFTRDGQSRYRVRGDGGLAYEIVPGPRDGTETQAKEPGDTRDVFAKSDMWVLNSNDSRIDDSALQAEGENDWGEAIHISQWLKDDAADTQSGKLDNQSVVVWYGTHFIHDVVAEQQAAAVAQAQPNAQAAQPEPNEGMSDHIVGPMIKPMQ